MTTYKPSSAEHPEATDPIKGLAFSGETSKFGIAVHGDSMRPDPPAAHVERHKPPRATRHDARTAQPSPHDQRLEDA